MLKKSLSSVRIYYPKYSTTEILKRISESLESLKNYLPLKLVVLFGSYAKKTYTAASDIDLLIVYEGKKREDAYIRCRKILNITRLELHIYSESEYNDNKQTVERMIKDGTLLYTT